ncbi:hypothetical protein B0I35DRAFT_439810 [Stachybotrys elegans]|uniref:Uncharacterized protein n=1 Tax=Stachybotrys elegans TaxID=80388 RepID=A0A8K0SQ37_9HYPO|nr:hypothetical protein B0I35DRAFT_439810 [Stachybotrys elegans]
MSDLTDSSCPEDGNSTDCLLRLVLRRLEANSEENGNFNWDPITFAFTVPISIFAATFALITIYQAILAAGPGRRKSNRRAIGSWADETRREWNWHDLNRLTIATTPVLRSEQLLDVLKIRAANYAADESLESNVPVGAVVKMGGSKPEPPAATWLAFLEHIGLQDLSLGEGGIDTATTMADYLPADLVAVPAYAEVGLIVVMAATSGAYSFRSMGESQYPVIIGNDFQFDFRQHPTLGTIGAFSRYGKRRTARVARSSLRQQLASAIQHARGNISTVQIIQGRPGVGVGAIDAKFDFQLSTNSVSPILRDDIFLRHNCVPQETPCLKQSCPPRDDKYGLFWLLVADTPRYLPAIFPVRLSRITSKALTMLALNSKVWSDPRAVNPESSETLDLFFPGHQKQWPPDARAGWYWLKHPLQFPQLITADYVSWMMRMIDMDATDEQIRVSARDADSDTVEAKQFVDIQNFLAERLSHEYVSIGFSTVIQQSRAFLYEFDEFQAWFHSAEPLQQQYFRGLVLLQIRQLDKWLGAPFKSTLQWYCRASTLYYSTLALLDAETAVSENAFNSPSEERPWLTLGLSRHQETLRALYAFLGQFPWIYDQKTDTCRTSSDYEKLMPLAVRVRYRKQIACLLGTQDPVAQTPRAICEIFLRLKYIIDIPSELYKSNDGEGDDGADQPTNEPVLDSDFNRQTEAFRLSLKHAVEEERKSKGDEGTVERSQKHSQYNPAEILHQEEHDAEGPPTEPKRERESSDSDSVRGRPARDSRSCEEVVDDALIWRAILNAMLYSTAPDSSDIIASGIWGHTIPVI